MKGLPDVINLLRNAIRYGHQPSEADRPTDTNNDKHRFDFIESTATRLQAAVDTKPVHFVRVNKPTQTLPYYVDKNINIDFRLGRLKGLLCINPRLGKKGGQSLNLNFDNRSEYEKWYSSKNITRWRHAAFNPSVAFNYNFYNGGNSPYHVWNINARRPEPRSVHLRVPDNVAPDHLVAQSHALKSSLTDKLIAHMTPEQKQLFERLS